VIIEPSATAIELKGVKLTILDEPYDVQVWLSLDCSDVPEGTEALAAASLFRRLADRLVPSHVSDDLWNDAVECSACQRPMERCTFGFDGEKSHVSYFCRHCDSGFNIERNRQGPARKGRSGACRIYFLDEDVTCPLCGAGVPAGTHHECVVNEQPASDVRTTLDRLTQRYLHDASFHALVSRFRSAIATGDTTSTDLSDALRLATLLADGDLERQRAAHDEERLHRRTNGQSATRNLPGVQPAGAATSKRDRARTPDAPKGGEVPRLATPDDGDDRQR
jgi:rubredoxin